MSIHVIQCIKLYLYCDCKIFFLHLSKNAYKSRHKLALRKIQFKCSDKLYMQRRNIEWGGGVIVENQYV